MSDESAEGSEGASDNNRAPISFAGWSDQSIVEYMVEWFEERFVDPAEETPYVDGEYLYVWGGPYDAHEELSGQFGESTKSDLILKAVEEVTLSGTHEWAPGSNHPDQISVAEEYAAEQAYQAYLDWLEVHEPSKLFHEARQQLEEYAAANCDPDGGSFVNRMIFMQAWSILESYLSAAMLKGVQESPAALKLLYEHNPDLKKRKFLGAELMDNGDLLKETALSMLRSKSFHNLPVIIPIFVNSFPSKAHGKFDPGPNYDQLADLLQKRHHCVHRNGVDLEDNPVSIEKDDIDAAIEIGTELVNRIDKYIMAHFDEQQVHDDPET